MKRTVVLLALTLLVAAWVYWMEVRDDTRTRTTEEVEQVSRTLVGATKREITGFALKPSGGDTIRIENFGDEWLMKEPVAARADEASVKEVLWDLEFCETAMTIGEAEVTDKLLEEYGLASPQGVIEVVTTSGVKSFDIGGANPGGEMVYIREGGAGPVLLVKKAFTENLEKTLLDMRSKTVVSLLPSQARLVKFFGPTKAELSKKEEYWNLDVPYVDHADPETINRVLEAASKLEVTSFVADSPENYAQYGLPDPDSPVVIEEGKCLTISEGIGGGKVVTVYFGNEAPGSETEAKMVYSLVRGEPTVFTLPEAAVNALFVGVDELQAKRIVRMDPYSLTRVTFSYGLDQVEFARKDFDWHVVKPFEAPADGKAVKDLLEAFSNVRMIEYLTPEPVKARYGLDIPKGSFSFVKGESRAVGVMFGNEAEDGSVYAMRSDTPGVFTVPKSLVDRLKIPALEFHTREMRKLSMDKAARISITRDGSSWSMEPSGGTGAKDWRLVEPADAPTNPLVVSRIVLALATTTASSLVEQNPRDLSAYGLDNPGITVRVDLADTQEQPAALFVGKFAEDRQRYAMLDGGNLVFTIDKDFARNLMRELRDSGVMYFSRTQVESVEFMAEGTVYKAVRTPDGVWTVEAPQGTSVKSTVIEDELMNLARLETERFVRYDTASLGDYGLLKPAAVVRVETPSGVTALSLGDKAPSGHYYATSTAVDGVFLIDPGDVINVVEPSKLFEQTIQEDASE